MNQCRDALFTGEEVDEGNRANCQPRLGAIPKAKLFPFWYIDWQPIRAKISFGKKYRLVWP
jgi:hypothetical protein